MENVVNGVNGVFSAYDAANGALSAYDIPLTLGVEAFGVAAALEVAKLFQRLALRLGCFRADGAMVSLSVAGDPRETGTDANTYCRRELAELAQVRTTIRLA